MHLMLCFSLGYGWQGSLGGEKCFGENYLELFKLSLVYHFCTLLHLIEETLYVLMFLLLWSMAGKDALGEDARTYSF